MHEVNRVERVRIGQHGPTGEDCIKRVSMFMQQPIGLAAKPPDFEEINFVSQRSGTDLKPMCSRLNQRLIDIICDEGYLKALTQEVAG
jgi:hypothetical protein